MSIGITITGINGRMGGMLAEVISSRTDCHIVGAIGRKGADYIGSDIAGVSITDDPHPAFAKSDAVIDFTPPPMMRLYAELAAQADVAYVCGSTGLEAGDWEALEKASQHTAVVYGSNMSLGMNLLTELVRQTAEKLRDYDIEITDSHHRDKKDAPSGTALSLGKAAAVGRGIDHDKAMTMLQQGVGEARKKDSIGYAVTRGGSVIGEHEVIFLGDKERLELCHRASSRDLFADGAVAAALWANGKKAGLYSMKDVLGL